MNFQGALERMPHKGAMRLIDRVVDASECHIHCVAGDHTADDYPLRLEGVLYTVELVELGAQAAAVHSSLYNFAMDHTGQLIGLKNVEFSGLVVEKTTGPLDIHAQQLHFDTGVALYSFKIRNHQQVILSGQALLQMKGEPI